VGDVVLLWSVAAAVAAQGHDVTLLTDARMAPLFQGDPAFRAVIGWDRAEWKRLGRWRGGLALGKAVRELRRWTWDVVMDAQGFLETAWLMKCLRAAQRFSRREVKDLPAPHHDIEELKKLCQLAGVWRGELDRPLQVDSHVETAAEVEWRRLGLEGRRVVAVNPGASFPAKRWDARGFGMVAEEVARRHGLTPLVFWGPGEEGLAQEVASASPSAVVAGPTSLPQLAALLRRCALVLTNDSGPMHLASAVHTPVVAVFFKEHSDPRVSGPLGTRHRVWWTTKPESGDPSAMVRLTSEVLSAPLPPPFGGTRPSVDSAG